MTSQDQSHSAAEGDEDDLGEEPDSLPRGMKNYMTPKG